VVSCGVPCQGCDAVAVGYVTVVACGRTEEESTSNMSTCGELLDRLEPPGHVVQLYGSDERLLIQNVGRFLSEGLRRGDGLLVIATVEHRTSLSRYLRSETSYQEAVLAGRLVFLDARATLSRFLVDGSPDLELFRMIISENVARVQARSVQGGARAYGEMVGLLWQEGKTEAAARLEALWNQLLSQNEVSLFCGYPVDVFSSDFESSKLDPVLCAHTHLLPVDESLEGALERAMQEVLGPRTESLRSLFSANHRPAWGSVPRAEALVLWLRNNLPGSADEILKRARAYYRPADT
jgi:hypothetical protein